MGLPAKGTKKRLVRDVQFMIAGSLGILISPVLCLFFLSIFLSTAEGGISADYTASPLSGQAPLSVAFSDASSDNPTSWLWLFGDGSSSNLRNPVHSYISPGAYAVTVTATNEMGSDSTTKTGLISVSVCPNLPVMKSGVSSDYFPTLRAAYDMALDNDIIKIRAMALADSAVFDRNIPVTLKGGYDCDFINSSQSTVINSVSIIDGTVEMENVEIGDDAPECVIVQPQVEVTVGNITGDSRVVQSFAVDGFIEMVDVMFGTYSRVNTKDIIFHLKDDIDTLAADLATMSVNASQLENNNWHRFEFSPVKSRKGSQYYIILESPESSVSDSVTAWASMGNSYPDGYLMQENGSTDRDLAFRVFTVSDGTGIEYFTWLDLTDDNWDRKIYRSRATDIAMTFGDRAIMEGGFYEHFFSYNLYDMFDYFCIPDDLIISYNDTGTFTSWVRAYGLNWTVQDGLLDNNQEAYLRHQYNNGLGYNLLTYDYNKGNGVPPPADITVQHDMTYGENYVPMTIKIRNKHTEPLRFIYVLQDGAWMTQDEPNQQDVHQYWDDGDYDFSRVWYIDGSNRANKNNWVGMYNDKNGGMFAATYAPPGSAGIRYHATWNRRWDQAASLPGLMQPNSLDPFGYNPISPDWFKYENLLSNIDALAPASLYNSADWKWHGTVIDFGVLQPDQEGTQVIVKIMFTRYEDRVDMHNRIRSIISRIPAYDLPVSSPGGN